MTIDADTHEAQTNPWLQGNYAPVDREIDAVDLPVEGELPERLVGTYLRNGPNPAFPPLGRYHIFDGDGMVHGLTLDGSTARYRNRWVGSKGLLLEQREGRALFGGLANFSFPPPEVVEEAGIMKNTANTNVIRHAGRILALMEGAPPTELDAELGTVGEYDFDGRLPGPMTAHPKWDPATGELLFFGYSPVPPYLRYHVADASGTLVRSIEIDLPRPVMMHDFVCTDDHAVFFDLPAVFDLEAAMSGGAPIRWDPESGARIGVLRRDQDRVRWIEVEPFYVFHFLNAWEDDGAIVVDGCRSGRMPTSFGDDDPFEEDLEPLLHRWRIDPERGAVGVEQLDDRPGDFPRIDDRRAGRPNRYGYLGTITSSDPARSPFDGVVKHDLEAGTSLVHRYGPDTESGEAVFAPDPDGSDEDDGWLLNLVFDRREGRSHLVVLDAHDLEPVARVALPQRVPFGFHGNWLPD